ncbi:hypothetical protein KY343_00700 [Candidatus Woesearchaeota archaeon]|nr:hypothetical protein [Candidatus Woesearchaeota archaeon]
MKGKKGEVSTSTMIYLAIGLVVLVGVLVFWLRGGTTFQRTTTELSPTQDSACIASTKTRAFTYEIKDIDGDNRDDQTCDWCVCDSGCNNDNDDKDGDKLPDKCDSKPDVISVVKFDENNCPEGNLVNLGDNKKQCRPS